MADEDTPVTKKDLKEFAQGIYMQVKMNNDKPKKAELNKTALNYQYNHNTAVLEKVVKAKEILQDLEVKDTELVDFLLGEAITLIKERNKQLMVADSATGGWATVKEMEKARLFDGDEEEAKLMRQAEKAVSERRKNQHQRPAPYKRSQRPFQVTGGFTGQRSFRNSAPSPYDVCRFCGSLGHWQRNCPQLHAGGYFPPVRNQQMPAQVPFASFPGIPAVQQPNFGKRF